jgi:SHS2 domain-containing protein
MHYRLLDHTADLGIAVWGENAKALFTNAAMALFDLITDVRLLRGTESRRLQVTGCDWPDLMVNWLRELLYLWTGEQKLVQKVLLHSTAPAALVAEVTLAPFDPGSHIVRQEIKAVTYHQIRVTGGPTRWSARIIFDV